jgi:hypothetical protein
MRRKSWQGQCEACGKKKDSNFSYRGLLHEEAPIKARCQDCAEKSQCDICGQ